ncbi:MAG: hypothetical protein CTY10_01240 [Methylotenera sp.]|nr:MAG: hypothetical protein CTY10_01240 [Methylotenera sp.]
MAFLTTKFYNCIEKDDKLRRPEKALFKLLCGFWKANGFKHLQILHDGGFEVFAARKLKIRVQCGHKVLAKKLGYARSDAVAPSIKGLVNAGYIKHFAGTGIKGQKKNRSKFSVFHLNIPHDYELPTKKKMPHEVALAIGKKALAVEYGAIVAHEMIAKAETDKVIAAAKAKPTLENFRIIAEAKRRLEANKIKVS